MIESDSFFYEISKFFLGLFIYFAFPAWIGLLLFFALKENREELFISLVYLILIYAIFIYVYKKSKAHYYQAKMDDQKITLKKNGKPEIEILWEEVAAIERVPLITPPLYFIQSSRLDKTLVFPSSSYFNNTMIAIGSLLIAKDFSKMGKHIKKMKKEGNIQSFYKNRAELILKRITK